MDCRFPEILAPVGGREQLEAAVKAGANAVYLAGTAFGARSSAANFDRNQMIAAIRYAHLHDVSVYITVNTLILDSEWEDAMDFVDFLYQNDADALIVQDVGLMSAIRERYPDFELHASTQMTFHNLAGVKYAKSLGFSRVVLPREMSLNEIKKISEEADVELEVFVHGALCVSYSGMCLMSSYIGGRSGNRGSCAQPCRKSYSLYSLDAERTYRIEHAHVLSPKDLSAADCMEELCKIPKISLKIEGRLKDKYYVYNVVSVYRRLADGLITPEEAACELERSYHRGYTRGFLQKESIVDFHAGEHTGHRGTHLGKVVSVQGGMLKIKLEDALTKGDEIQCRRGDGSSVGTRADRIDMAGKPVVTAPAGTSVSVPFKHRLSPGEILYKTYSVEQNARIDRKLNQDIKIWNIKMESQFKIGEPSRLRAFVYRIGEDVNSRTSSLFAEVVGDIVEPATGSGTDRRRIVEQLSKTGGTPFRISEEESTFDIEEGIFIPISAVNALRRELFEKLTAHLERRYPDRKFDGERYSNGEHSNSRYLSRRCSDEEDVCKHSEKSVISARSVVSENTAGAGCTLKSEHTADSEQTAGMEYAADSEQTAGMEHAADSEQTAGMEHAADSEQTVRTESVACSDRLILPPVISTADWERYQEKIDSADTVEIGHLSHLAFRGLSDKHIIGSYTLNIMNSHALGFYLGHRVDKAEISTEIRRSDLDGDLVRKLNVQRIFNFDRERITLMRMAYCPVGAYFGGGQKCGLCRTCDFAIRDEKGVEFPLHLDDRTCMAEVLSPGRKRKGKKITDLMI